MLQFCRSLDDTRLREIARNELLHERRKVDQAKRHLAQYDTQLLPLHNLETLL